MTPDVPEEDPYFKDISEWMEQTLGIESSGKIETDDWMLVIRLHAMIEAGLNSTLTMHFAAPELEKVIGKLDTSDGSRGKAAFARALDMLDKSALVFLQKLSELRNLCVHNIRHFRFDFPKHLDGLEPGERNAVLNAMSKEIGDEMEMIVGGVALKGQQILGKSPQMGLVGATMSVMMKLHLHHWKCRARDAEAKSNKLKAKLFDIHEQNQSKPKEE